MKKFNESDDAVSRKLFKVQKFLKGQDRVFEREEHLLGPELAALQDRDLTTVARLVYTYIRTLARSTNASPQDIAHDLGIDVYEVEFALSQLKMRKYIDYWSHTDYQYHRIQATNVMESEWSNDAAARYLDVDVKTVESFKRRKVLTATGSGVTLFSLMVLKRYQITKREYLKEKFISSYRRIQNTINL